MKSLNWISIWGNDDTRMAEIIDYSVAKTLIEKWLFKPILVSVEIVKGHLM